MRISTDATTLLTDRVDQLDAMRVRKHAAFQHIEHGKFWADLPDSDPTVPVGKDGGALNHKTAAQQRERQIGDRAVADPVHQVVFTRMLVRGAGLNPSRTAGQSSIRVGQYRRAALPRSPSAG